MGEAARPLPKRRKRIDRGAAEADLEMKVRSERPSRGAHEAESGAGVHTLANSDVDA